MISTISMLALALTLALSTPLQGGSAPAAPAEGNVTALQEARTGLPPRAAPPRTMEAQWPVFAAFALSWIGIVGYALVTARRAARLAEGVRELEERR